MLILLTNELSAQFDVAIDKALAGRPCDDDTRQYLRNWLICYYDEHGTIPEFDLKENFQKQDTP